MPKSINGFTIVELLVAITVIGILAAISTVAYNGIQNRAHDTAVRADLRNAFTKIKVHALEKGAYPRSSSELAQVKIRASQSSYATAQTYNFIYCPPFPYSTSSYSAMIGQSKSGKLYIHGSGGASIYTGSLTMNDYADICAEITDRDGTFDGDFANNPEFWVTASGYESTRTPRWHAWATGGS